MELYTPLIKAWLARMGLTGQDADDVTQNVMMVLVRRMGDFERQPRPGAFRRWLRTITANCLRDFWRAERSRPRADWSALVEQMEGESGLSALWDREHDQHVTRQLLDLIRPAFEPNTWEAFRRTALAGESPSEVAASLGMTVNAVFIARSRVLGRLRQEGTGLID
ncbi:MAG: sigma-70 family RNA polymerase sigma factor [Gemmataceae bacterium]|nr:sigma-70 family RNA polymerase sigma factor [Gemmataceae bacterium]